MLAKHPFIFALEAAILVLMLPTSSYSQQYLCPLGWNSSTTFCSGLFNESNYCSAQSICRFHISNLATNQIAATYGASSEYWIYKANQAAVSTACNTSSISALSSSSCPFLTTSNAINSEACNNSKVFACGRDISKKALGMQNGAIKDKQLQSSSFYKTSSQPIGYAAKYSRFGINYIPGTLTQGGWCSSTASTGEYLQINFDKTVVLTKLEIQGVKGRYCDFWTTVFNLSYKGNSDMWRIYVANGSFNANADADSVVTANFSVPLIANNIRIYPVAYGTNCPNGEAGRFCLRMEAYGMDLTSNNIEFKKNNTGSDEKYKNDKTLKNHHHKDEINWPAGNYALPKPKTGCPSSSGVNWKHAYRLGNYKITNDSTSSNTNKTHLLNTISSTYFVEEFCIKSPDGEDGPSSFPPGKYCVNQVGESCPDGFQTGSLKFYEEGSIGSKSWSHTSGDRPKSTPNYDQSSPSCCHTDFHYCCKDDVASGHLKIPSGMPFYLLPVSNTCPNITDSKSSLEHVDFSLGATPRVLNDLVSGIHPYVTLSVVNNGSANNYIMRYHLCYYEPLVTAGKLLVNWAEETVNANYELGLKISLFTGNNLIRYGNDSNLRIDVSLTGNCSAMPTPAFIKLLDGVAVYDGSISAGTQCPGFVNATVTFNTTTYLGHELSVTRQINIVSKTNIFVFVRKEHLKRLAGLYSGLRNVAQIYSGENGRNINVTVHAYENASDVQRVLRVAVNKSKCDADNVHGIIAINSQDVQDVINSVATVKRIPFITGNTKSDMVETWPDNTLVFTTKADENFANSFRAMKRRNISEIILIHSEGHKIPLDFAYYMLAYKVNISSHISLADNSTYNDIMKDMRILQTRKVAVYFAVVTKIASNVLKAAIELAVSPINGYVWISGSHAGVYEQAVGSKDCYRLSPMTCSEAFRGVMMLESARPVASYTAHLDASVILTSETLSNISSTLHLKLMENMIVDGANCILNSVTYLASEKEPINARKITEDVALMDLTRLKNMRLARKFNIIEDTGVADICAGGWTGNNCSQPLCLTQCETEDGECVASDICECHPGYYGIDCTGNCEGKCQHGVCNGGRLGDGTCIKCEWLYAGVYCDKPAVLKALIASCLGSLVVGVIATCYVLRICRPKQQGRVSNDKDESKWILEWSALTEVEKVSVDKAVAARHLAEKMRYTEYFKARLDNKNAFVMCIKKRPVKLSLDVRLEIRRITQIDHINIEKVMGVCLGPPYVAIVTELASMGSLYDTLHAENVDVPLEIKYTFMEDICRGMAFLHDKCRMTHGKLKSTNCLLHKGWRVKITDIGLASLRKRSNNKIVYQMNKIQNDAAEKKQVAQLADYNSLLWTAPEYLGEGITNIDQIENFHFGGDVYSFGILMAEIITRVPPYEEIKVMSTQHIIEAIAHLREPMVDLEVIRPGTSKVKRDTMFRGGTKVLRPKLKSECLPKDEPARSILRLLMESAWSDDPGDRPPFSHIKNVLKIIVPLKGDQMAKRAFLLEKETEMLEKYIAYDTKMINKEREKIDDWFNRLLPPEISTRYVMGENVEPRQFEIISVAAFQIVNFQQLIKTSQPSQLISLVDYLMKMLYAVANDRDFEISQSGLFSGTYVIVSGSDTPDTDHVDDLIQYSLQVLRSLKKIVISYKHGLRLNLRAAIHSGKAVGGLVYDYGKTPRYRIFSEAVKIAVQLSRRSDKHCLLITEASAVLMKNRNDIRLIAAPERGVKNESQKAYWVTK